MRELLNLPERFVLFDLECTTWEGAAARNWSGPGEHREVVQVGAVLTDNTRFGEMVSFKIMVRPEKNPVLSDYFINLTGITQQEVDDNGIDFSTFFRIFYRWCMEFPLYCFDSRTDRSRLFDYDVLKENYELAGMLSLFQNLFSRDRFHNINEIFHQYGYAVKQSGSAPAAFGIEIPARPHNALNDIRGMLIALRALKERV